jgi:hypothetical protein
VIAVAGGVRDLVWLPWLLVIATAGMIGWLWWRAPAAALGLLGLLIGAFVGYASAHGRGVPQRVAGLAFVGFVFLGLAGLTITPRAHATWLVRAGACALLVGVLAARVIAPALQWSAGCDDSVYSTRWCGAGTGDGPFSASMPTVLFIYIAVGTVILVGLFLASALQVRQALPPTDDPPR